MRAIRSPTSFGLPHFAPAADNDGCQPLCLSDLPDDLLRHILSFAPAKEAAATAVISRRWRSLWRTCGAVNLDSRSYGRCLNSAETRGGFFRGAEAALAAARKPSGSSRSASIWNPRIAPSRRRSRLAPAPRSRSCTP
ncbi:hypothetical protein C2845_PM07G26050 [Panicum miliaceum]|uniref:F-box domain-containing protein n=1 Tax=Panicum miliaceum TaxID=4540 RepID=A0A3L6SVV3_PANMI|nr:hypothetical protein C2845_PM07G26050 [Panicum miliaceum]